MKLGDPVNIDAYLGKSRERVCMVGVELEGGWEKKPQGWVHDGSVRIGVQPENGMIIVTGEVPSPPLDLKEQLPGWMKKFYPKYVNETCGMHVHMSFKNALSYQRLMTASYPSTVIKYMGLWAKENKLDLEHPIWDRLYGKSRYCQHVFFADDQVLKTEKDHSLERTGHRYTVVNYCWGRYQSVECRLLPMMANHELALNAINRLVQITNAFLTSTSRAARKEKKLSVIHVADEDVERMERRSYV